MNEEELAAIEARAEAATPGPWLTPEEANVLPPVSGITPVDHEGCFVWPWGDDDEVRGRKDMVFAYAAREDVPKLIAEIRRLKGLLG
jgi:hypothetical protein